MQAFLLQLVRLIGTHVLKAFASMGMALLTERFIKELVVHVLRRLKDRTKTDWDDKLLKSIEEAWGIPPES